MGMIKNNLTSCFFFSLSSDNEFYELQISKSIVLVCAFVQYIKELVLLNLVLFWLVKLVWLWVCPGCGDESLYIEWLVMVCAKGYVVALEGFSNYAKLVFILSKSNWQTLRTGGGFCCLVFVFGRFFFGWSLLCMLAIMVIWFLLM